MGRENKLQIFVGILGIVLASYALIVNFLLYQYTIPINNSHAMDGQLQDNASSG